MGNSVFVHPFLDFLCVPIMLGMFPVEFPYFSSCYLCSVAGSENEDTSLKFAVEVSPKEQDLNPIISRHCLAM